MFRTRVMWMIEKFMFQTHPNKVPTFDGEITFAKRFDYENERG